MDGLESNVELSLRFSSSFFDLDENQLRPLAILGRAYSYLSAYEHDCDSFIFSVVEHEPSFVAKHKFKPTFNKDSERRVFITKAIDEIQSLSAIKDGAASPDKAYVAKAMEMVWHHRTNLAHGRLVATKSEPEGVEFTFQRWSRDSTDKYQFHHSTYRYDLELLESVLHHASYIRTILSKAQKLVAGDRL